MNDGRRTMMAWLMAATATAALGSNRVQAQDRFRMGITPVFLDNDANLLTKLGRALTEAFGLPVEFEQRRTYEEVTGLLLQGSVDVAWLCGFPYLQHRSVLSVLAVPAWRGQPRYQAYLIARADDPAASLSDLKGATHAFSDPDSNSGYLTTATDLVRSGQNPANFFRRSIFTYGHRNVVRAVASGLVRSGSVDGYVWEVLASQEPELARQTKVIGKSEWAGFPPFCARTDRMAEPKIRQFQDALLALGARGTGKQALDLLQFDRLILAEPDLYAGIAQRMRDLDAAQ